MSEAERSLASILDSALSASGSALRSSSDVGSGFVTIDDPERRAETIGTDDRVGERSATVWLAPEPPRFDLMLVERIVEDLEIVVGRTDDLDVVVAVIRRTLEHRIGSLIELPREFAFLGEDHLALAWQRDADPEERWQQLLGRRFVRSHEDLFHQDDLPLLIREASTRPELRRLIPYTSHFDFSVTSRNLPYARVPLVRPLGGGRYQLLPEGGGGPSGTVDEILDALIEALPPGI